MINLYYTTTAGPNLEQLNPINSIGGYRSITKVQNDTFDALFDELSLLGMKNAEANYKALILYNEGNETLKNVEFWFEQDSTKINYCDFLIAFVALSTDEEGFLKMESTSNSSIKPFYAEFHSATPTEKVSIGDLDPNVQIGIWICRTPLKTVILEDYKNVAERDVNTQSRYKRVEKETEESIGLQISWE